MQPELFIHRLRACSLAYICLISDPFADTMYEEFLLHPKMVGVRDRAVWVHLTMPGQGKQAEDLPAE